MNFLFARRGAQYTLTTSYFSVRITLALAILTTLLGACSSIQPQPSLSSDDTLLKAWRIQGKISVKTANDRINAAINWQQIEKQYQLSLSGLFGQGLTRISGDDQQLTLQTHTGKTLQDDPQSVLQQHLGWQFPLAYFRYWVQGAIAPNEAANEVKINELGALTHFTQAGWQVQFSRHKSNALLRRPLPAKILAKRGNMTVILVIKAWQPVADTTSGAL